jgi:hypothetical protein
MHPIICVYRMQNAFRKCTFHNIEHRGFIHVNPNTVDVTSSLKNFILVQAAPKFRSVQAKIVYP